MLGGHRLVEQQALTARLRELLARQAQELAQAQAVNLRLHEAAERVRQAYLQATPEAQRASDGLLLGLDRVRLQEHGDQLARGLEDAWRGHGSVTQR